MGADRQVVARAGEGRRLVGELVMPVLLSLAFAGACGHSKSSSPQPATPTSSSSTQDATAAGGGGGGAGAAGAPGKDGANGVNGANGIAGGVQLYDANDRVIGNKFSSDSGTVASVLLFDGKQALIDRSTGVLAPYMSFFCMHTTNDCSGACYVYDSRWWDTVVSDHQGHTWVSPHGTASAGAKTMNSYVAADLSCTVGTIGTTDSYVATAYTAPSLTFPLPAPLYWGLARQ